MTRRLVGVAMAAAAAMYAGAGQFVAHTIATDLRGGYQVVPFDVNRDGKTDLIALASNMPELVWFENPGWQRHVLANGLNRMINLAACAGVEEIVVAHEFANVPANSPGVVSVLTPGANRSEPWSVREIDRIPTSHRLRCVKMPDGKTVIVNAVLAGVKATAPEYRDHPPLVYYKPGEWKRILIGEENEGVMHGIFITPWNSGSRQCVLTASFLGVHSYCPDKSSHWTRTEVTKGDPSPWPKSGASDVAVGHLGKQRFLAVVEPWHGNQVSIYTEKDRKWERQVIETGLVDGHTILAVDVDRDGRDEVVAGYRGTGRSVYLYSNDKSGTKWTRTALDDGGIAAAACAAVDLNGDSKPDITCIGQASTNLKWYENTTPR